ncbi:MAG: HPt (histidine-containing phosphotransfer) domain-containing protein [Patiriisocius sp.]|jgi:HPt (histidine-containing phosphotransfer) domain-containing protein
MDRNYSKASLNEIAGGDEDFVIIVAKTFLEEIPPDLAALKEAIENDNKELAYQFAHKMKPNLEMFGIEVQKDVTSIESWTKSSRSNSSIQINIDTLTNVLYLVFEELKEDFPS